MLFMQLKLKGKVIKGDCTISGYEEQIELTSMNWGVFSRDKTTAKGSSKVESDWNGEALKIEKFLDGASTVMYGHVDEREGLRSTSRSALSRSETDNTAVISMVAVSAVKSGEKMPVLMRVKLAGCRIMSITTKASASGLSLSMREDIQLAYKKLEIDYFPAASGGQRGAATSFSFVQKA